MHDSQDFTRPAGIIDVQIGQGDSPIEKHLLHNGAPSVVTMTLGRRQAEQVEVVRRDMHLGQQRTTCPPTSFRTKRVEAIEQRSQASASRK